MTTLTCVPSSGTPKQTIRVEGALWDEFGEVCKAEGTNRAEDIREHMKRRIQAHRGQDASALPPAAADVSDLAAAED